MKTIVCMLLAIGTWVATASAGPGLVVDTVVTDLDAQGKDIVVGRFHVLTESGKPVVMPVDQRRYAVTPTLREDGTIDLAQTMTHPNDKGADVVLGPYQQNEHLGETREISFGNVTYSTKVSQVK